MSGFDAAVWIYLSIGLTLFVIEFRKYDDHRKWLILPILLLFITFLWPWLMIVNVTDRAKKTRQGEP
jgi:hypothetical protein